MRSTLLFLFLLRGEGGLLLHFFTSDLCLTWHRLFLSWHSDRMAVFPPVTNGLVPLQTRFLPQSDIDNPVPSHDIHTQLSQVMLSVACPFTVFPSLPTTHASPSSNARDFQLQLVLLPHSRVALFSLTSIFLLSLSPLSHTPE